MALSDNLKQRISMLSGSLESILTDMRVEDSVARDEAEQKMQERLNVIGASLRDELKTLKIETVLQVDKRDRAVRNDLVSTSEGMKDTLETRLNEVYSDLRADLRVGIENAKDEITEAIAVSHKDAIDQMRAELEQATGSAKKRK